MLQKDYSEGKFYAKCDHCDHFESVPGENFKEATVHLKGKNWFITMGDKEYEHYCSKCMEKKPLPRKIKQRKKDAYASFFLTDAPKTINGKCPDCGGDLVLRESKFGHFYGCNRYPKCTVSLNLDFVVKTMVKKEG